ncbi:PR domain zinc finger protein 15-like [Paramacrobiotus metropolitanus]|uniref:PR domain zinc finger protein 15-like n=1 Tax=Paramacrobiotus metropolitanus TaxID=2943436 RepID=UPI0024460EC1|nr:PR domain zinc finger protein 15-like [Paramacrobiotus metropolitanus]
MEPNSWGGRASPPREDDGDRTAAPGPAAPLPGADASQWCAECWRGISDPPCTVHGPLHHIPDRPLPPRAVATAPTQVTVRRLSPAADGRTVRGVFASADIASRTLFGPLEAPALSVPLCLGEDQFLLKKFRAGESSAYLDVSNEAECNWLMYVRPARSWAEQNLVAYQHEDDIYFAAFRFIPAQTELRVWYSEEYAGLMGVDLLNEAPKTRDAADPVSSRRRKAARPQRVPQTRPPHIAVVESRAPHRPPPPPVPVPAPPPTPAVSLILKDEPAPVCHVVTNIAPAPPPPPPALPPGENILLICENPSSNGMPPTSLLLLTSGPAPAGAIGQSLLKTSFDIPVIGESFVQKRPPIRIQPSPGLAVSWPGTTKSSIVISSNDESMADSIRSPGDRSGDSDEDSSREQRLLRSSGGSLRPYICSYPACSKYFSSKYKLLRHELIHSQEKRHHCQLCHKKFHRKDHLNNHLKVHERSKVRLECVLCGCVFAKKWTYEKHLSLHERDANRGDGPVPIRSLEEMDAEEDNEEEDEQDAEDDNEREEEEEEEPEPDWVTVHQQSPNSAFHLEAPASPEEEEEAPPPPPVRQVAPPPPSLIVRVQPPPPPGKRAIPLSQRPAHPCSSCGKVFSASKDLRRHLQTHLGIKPNLCPYCPKKFTRKDHVRRHIQTVHGRDKELRDKSMAANGINELQVLAQ